MSEIYKGAVVTISAATASTSNEGFLQPRKASTWSVPQFQLPFHSSDDKKGKILLILYECHSFVRSQNFIESRDPIDDRA